MTSSTNRSLKNVLKDLEKINALKEGMSLLSDDQMYEKRGELQRRIDSGESIDGSIKHEAFALAREASYRVLGKMPYNVQVLGGLVMHDKKIAEMSTGEGKTITAAMPTFLNALSGKGVHVITVNDYLAVRDAEQIGKVHEFLGLSVGVIGPDMQEALRREAYKKDITYGTNSEFGFDFLRDNLRFDISQRVQRGHHYAILDEADSILIDDARTPLIISAPVSDDSDICKKIDDIVKTLVIGKDFSVDEKLRTVSVEEQGIAKIDKYMQSLGIVTSGMSVYSEETTVLVHHINAALKSYGLFQKNRDYAVKDGEVIIVDESTGRMMPGRRFSDGIHQAIEAKEGVDIQSETQSLTSITYQNYFRLYEKLSGMTGTAITEKEELMGVYGLDVIKIPTNKPVLRVDEIDEVHLTLRAKFSAIVEEVRAAHEAGQPVLVGTASVEKSDLMARYLNAAGFKEFDPKADSSNHMRYQVLNARNHMKEADIIAAAGKTGAVTIATNMAGRGTDIELGGSLSLIDDKIENTQLSDSELKHLKEDAELIKTDKEAVLSAGGLLVIGTERHDSRRVDNQLRGRSGRQGDPGRSKFFVSLEDDIVRLFAPEKLEATVRNIGLVEGDVVRHPIISKLLESAQKKVEQRNYEVRANVLKYDDINDQQRHAMQEYRNDIMSKDDVYELVDTMRERAIRRAIDQSIPVNSWPDQWNLDALGTKLTQLTGMKFPLVEWANEDGILEDEIYERIMMNVDVFENERKKHFDDGVFDYALKHILLETFDKHWREHLASLELLKDVVSFRTYAQRDPVIEYRTDAFQMFEGLLVELADEVTSKSSRLVSTKPKSAEELVA